MGTLTVHITARTLANLRDETKGGTTLYGEPVEVVSSTPDALRLRYTARTLAPDITYVPLAVELAEEVTQ